MTVKRFMVSSYQVKLGQAMSSTWSEVDIKARGVISCHGEGHKFIAYFLAEDSPVPDPVYKVNDKVGTIFLPFADMPPFIDLLRNEKPIYAYMNSDKPQWNSIGTSLEPVGEEET